MRKTRFLRGAQALTAASWLLPTALASRLLSPPVALAAGGAFAWATWKRLAHTLGDPPRPRARAVALESVLFCHWTGGLLGLVLWPLTGSAVLAYGTGLVLGAWGVWGRRRWVVMRHYEVALRGLPQAFDGYRIAQLSDLHVGTHDGLERARQWVKQANGAEADLVVVTGDLVTAGTAYYPLVAEALAGLEARDGTIVSLGNHDQWDHQDLVQQLEAQGVVVLQNRWLCVERDQRRLVVAGLDDRYARRADLPETLRGRPDAVTVLLSHYPDFFEEAAEHGVDLVLSGHTHGGQLGVPFLSRWLNVGRLMGQRPGGWARLANTQLYVNSGLGTTGLPVRLGIPPEIAVFTLRRL